MSSRSLRVNELLKREISTILHTDYREHATGITIIDVDTAPDLRQARVYFSVLGDTSVARDADAFFTRNHKAIRQKVSKVIVLKYLPHLRFIRDEAMERGNRLVELLDEVSEEESRP